jgi:LysM repeat protein
MDSKYHIDVTEEEDRLFRDQTEYENGTKRKPNSKLIWALVVSVHIGLIGAAVRIPTLLASEPTPIQTTKQTSQLKAEDQVFVATPEPVITNNTTSNATVASHHQEKPNKSNLTQTYTVKHGDTVYSISRKYKLNVSKLIKLNDLKDPNKIVPGQTLKFL